MKKQKNKTQPQDASKNGYPGKILTTTFFVVIAVIITSLVYAVIHSIKNNFFFG